MPAHLTPQEAVIHYKRRPADCHIVVVILAGRLGTHLSLDALKRPDGSAYLSGTEWEFEDAWNASPRPDILVYRRMDIPPIGVRDPNREERLRQYKLVEQFFERFKNPDGSWKSGYQEYEGVEVFEAKLASDLKHLVLERLHNLPPPIQPPPDTAPIVPPVRCFGRDDDVTVLVTALDTSTQAALLVLGTGASARPRSPAASPPTPPSPPASPPAAGSSNWKPRTTRLPCRPRSSRPSATARHPPASPRHWRCCHSHPACSCSTTWRPPGSRTSERCRTRCRYWQRRPTYRCWPRSEAPPHRPVRVGPAAPRRSSRCRRTKHAGSSSISPPTSRGRSASAAVRPRTRRRTARGRTGCTPSRRRQHAARALGRVATSRPRTGSAPRPDARSPADIVGTLARPVLAVTPAARRGAAPVPAARSVAGRDLGRGSRCAAGRRVGRGGTAASRGWPRLRARWPDRSAAARSGLRKKRATTRSRGCRIMGASLPLPRKRRRWAHIWRSRGQCAGTSRAGAGQSGGWVACCRTGGAVGCGCSCVERHSQAVERDRRRVAGILPGAGRRLRLSRRGVERGRMLLSPW